MNTFRHRRQPNRKIECFFDTVTQNVPAHCLTHEVLQNHHAAIDKIHVQQGGNVLEGLKHLWKKQTLAFAQTGNNRLWKTDFLFGVTYIYELHAVGCLFIDCRTVVLNNPGAGKIGTTDLHEALIVLQVVLT